MIFRHDFGRTISCTNINEIISRPVRGLLYTVIYVCVSTQSTALVVHTTQNYARQITPPASNGSMRKPAVCSAVRPGSRPSMRLCHLKRTLRTKAAVPWPLRLSHPTQPRSQWPARSPSLAHDLATRPDVTALAAPRHTSSAAPHALRSPSPPSLLVTQPVWNAHASTRLSCAAPAPPAPLLRHCCPTPAPPPRVSFRACCLRTDKGAGLGLAWQRLGGELQRGENVAESEAEAEHREMPAGWKGTRTLGTVGRPPARDISLWRAASKRPHVT